MYNFNIEFEYDPGKSAANRLKHGISLEEVQKLWLVSRIIIQAHSVDEPRYMVIGRLEDKFYSCVFTMRGSVIRLISARRSRKEEELIYHEKIGQEED